MHAINSVLDVPAFAGHFEGRVISAGARPSPGLAIITAGKRRVGYATYRSITLSILHFLSEHSAIKLIELRGIPNDSKNLLLSCSARIDYLETNPRYIS